MRRRCDERPLLPRRGGGPAVNVTLAPVPQSEHDDFFAMAEAYFRELDRYDPMVADRGGIEGFRRATLDDAEGRELLWVLADGERAGLAVVRTLPDWPDETRTVASIAEFTVLPAHRRSGVGRAAVEALLAAHRRRGTALVEAEILRDNEPAKAFWAALGFEVQSIRTVRRP